MHRTLKCDLARVILSRGFAAAVIATAILCFSAQVYTDISNGKTYSAIEALFAFDRGFMMKNIDFSPPVIINKALSGYSAMVLPVTASFPFVLSFIAERSSGNMRFTISRTKRGKYCFSKFVTAISGGGACAMFGVILFGIFVYVLFPNANSPEMLDDVLQNGVLLSLVKTALSAFVYGMTSVLPAFFLCSFCKNTHIILCVPFVLRFIWETLLTKIQTNAFAAEDFGLYERITPFYPNMASKLFDMPVSKTFYETIAVNVFLVIITFAGFVFFMEKRSDRGC